MASPGFWNAKRVLVTGHTGFKGAWLSLWLRQRGAEVVGFSLAPVSDPSLFELADLKSEIDSITGDIREISALRECVSHFKPELVFHMAAQSLVRASYRDPIGTYATNVMGTVNLLECVRETPETRVVVNVTSDKCYENREWAWGYRENERMGGHDPYSSSKGCSELVTAAYRRSFLSSVGVATGRAGNVIGGGDWAEDRLIPDCMRALARGEAIGVRNPTSVRPWQHVLEPLRGYLLLAEKLWEKPADFSEGWNFGPEVSDARSVSWIADRITGLWGNGARWEQVESDTAPHEAHSLKLDCSLAKSRLGWKPRLSLSEALEWVVGWYQELENGQSAAELTIAQIKNYEQLGEKNDG